MKSFIYSKYFQKGQSIFEVIFSLAISSLILVALVSLSTQAVKNTRISKNTSTANEYANEVNEFLRKERDTDWATFLANSSTSGTTWCFSDSPIMGWPPGPGACGTTTITGTPYVREVVLTQVNVYSIESQSKVVWSDSDGVHDTQSNTSYTDWRSATDVGGSVGTTTSTCGSLGGVCCNTGGQCGKGTLITGASDCPSHCFPSCNTPPSGTLSTSPNPINGPQPLTAFFSGVFTDAQGDSMSYFFNFGDGPSSSSGSGGNIGVSHIYQNCATNITCTKTTYPSGKIACNCNGDFQIQDNSGSTCSSTQSAFSASFYTCGDNGDSCTSSSNCCSGSCILGICQTSCSSADSYCTSSADCCSGLSCVLNTCQ